MYKCYYHNILFGYYDYNSQIPSESILILNFL